MSTYEPHTRGRASLQHLPTDAAGWAGSRPISVAFVSEHASPLARLGGQDAGGQNVYVDEVSRNLGRLGLRVDVFTRRDDPALPAVVEWAPGVRVVHIDAGAPRFQVKDTLWPLMPRFLAGIEAFAQHTDVSYDVVHGNFWMSGWVAVELAQAWGIPAVQIFHAMGKTKQLHQGDADTSPAERIVAEMGVVERVDRLIAQCPSEQRELVEAYAADPSKVSVIPSAVNIDTFRPVPQAEARARIGLGPDELVVAYVGRMLPRKDVRNVVRAMALLQQRMDQPVRLLLVGGETVEPDPRTTPEIGVLQQLASELGIADQVLFTGKRQGDALRDYYSAGDIAVTTPWYEPFGLTPLEGMACGRPVIGSAVGGITFTIDDGVTGLLVPPRDPAALAQRLEELLRDPARRARMGHAARRRAEEYFTWSTVAERTAALYEHMLSTPEQATRARIG